MMEEDNAQTLVNIWALMILNLSWQKHLIYFVKTNTGAFTRQTNHVTFSYLFKNNCNEKRKRLIKIALLMLDESMSGWRQKTSKLGICQIIIWSIKYNSFGNNVDELCIVSVWLHFLSRCCAKYQNSKSKEILCWKFVHAWWE